MLVHVASFWLYKRLQCEQKLFKIYKWVQYNNNDNFEIASLRPKLIVTINNHREYKSPLK